MSILEVNNIKKSFPEGNNILEVLNGIDLKISAGETIAITGESGSGKSTLLHIMGLLDKPTSGTILFNNEEVDFKEAKMAKLRNRKIGFVFQMHYLLEDFNAEENVALPMFLQNKNMTNSKKKARELLKKLEIYDRREHYLNELSGGEQQRVAIARALINNPEIVLADEPTGNLDERHSQEIIDLIKDLNQDYNQSFVLVTHNQHIAKQMAKNYYLHNGILLKK